MCACSLYDIHHNKHERTHNESSLLSRACCDEFKLEGLTPPNHPRTFGLLGLCLV